jgi:Na+/glutamate symporter
MTSKVDFIKVNLSDPCIFSLVQCPKNPTLLIDYDINEQQNNPQNKQQNNPQNKSSSTNYVTDDTVTTQQSTQKIQKSNIVHNIFVVALVLLLIYAICLLVNKNKNKNNKKYFVKPFLR